jgi:hypothetical protein
MQLIAAIRIEQELVWNEDEEDYDPATWHVTFLNEGETEWKKIPVLFTHRGGPSDGVSFIPNETKEKTNAD